MKRAAALLLVGLLFFAAAVMLVHRDLVFTALDELAVLYLRLTAADGGPDPIALEEGTAPAEPDPVENRDGADPAAADIERLARQITAGISGEYGKLEAVYDWVTHNIAYDLEKAKNIQAYGAGAGYLLRTRRGVCHDYAELTRALLEAAGIEATYESGEVYAAPGEVERHAWNQALAGGTWYALDTTWGSGFPLEDEERFVQKPRRLYLTTPAELKRLHGDPAYRDERELAYMKEEAAAAAPVYLPDYEQRLVLLLNDHRAAAGLPALEVEERLAETARQNAARYAEAICRGETDYSLDELKQELEQRSATLRIGRAGMCAISQWAAPLPPAPEELYASIKDGQQDYLDDPAFRKVAVGVIRQGDLTTVVHIYIEPR